MPLATRTEPCSATSSTSRARKSVAGDDEIARAALAQAHGRRETAGRRLTRRRRKAAERIGVDRERAAGRVDGVAEQAPGQRHGATGVEEDAPGRTAFSRAAHVHRRSGTEHDVAAIRRQRRLVRRAPRLGRRRTGACCPRTSMTALAPSTTELGNEAIGAPRAQRRRSSRQQDGAVVEDVARRQLESRAERELRRRGRWRAVAAERQRSADVEGPARAGRSRQISPGPCEVAARGKGRAVLERQSARRDQCSSIRSRRRRTYRDRAPTTRRAARASPGRSSASGPHSPSS